jgi:hypothetical protein
VADDVWAVTDSSIEETGTVDKLEVVWVEQRDRSQVLRGIERFNLHVIVREIPDKPAATLCCGVEWVVERASLNLLVTKSMRSDRPIGTDIVTGSDPVKTMARAKSEAMQHALSWLRDNDPAARTTVINAISW